MKRAIAAAEVLCRRHNISETTLGRWRDEFLAGGTAALGAGKTQQNVQSGRIEELEQSLAGRDQVIGELTIAHRILKKTCAAVVAVGATGDGSGRLADQFGDPFPAVLGLVTAEEVAADAA